MQTITTAQASAQLDKLIQQTAANHEPVVITGEQTSAVILSQEDWNAVAETIGLNTC